MKKKNKYPKLFLTNFAILVVSLPLMTIVSCGRTFDKYVNLKTEIDKLQNFTTINGINKENNDLSSAIIGDDITTKFKAITEWGTTGNPAPLTSRWKNSVSIKSVIVNTL